MRDDLRWNEEKWRLYQRYVQYGKNKRGRSRDSIYILCRPLDPRSKFANGQFKEKKMLPMSASKVRVDDKQLLYIMVLVITVKVISSCSIGDNAACREIV